VTRHVADHDERLTRRPLEHTVEVAGQHLLDLGRQVARANGEWPHDRVARQRNQACVERADDVAAQRLRAPHRVPDEAGHSCGRQPDQRRGHRVLADHEHAEQDSERHRDQAQAPAEQQAGGKPDDDEERPRHAAEPAWLDDEEGQCDQQLEDDDGDEEAANAPRPRLSP
jgi:hypothetical protein